MTKKLLFASVCAAIVLSFALGSVAFAEEAYFFDTYDVEIYVNSDYTFEVIETLYVEFNEYRHGIYRSLPNYWGEDRIKYKNITVDGAPLKIERSTDYTNLRIGDADEVVIGSKKYVISYTVQLPKDSNPNIDSVYMNVIGDEHPVYTMNSSIKLTLPKSTTPDYIEVFCGYFGEKNKDKIEYLFTDKKRLVVKLLEPLYPYEGITVKIDLEEGYFTNVKEPFFLGDFIKKTLPFLLILAGIVIWFIFGRDKKVIPPVELALDDISPAEAGYIIDGEISGDDVASMLIFWASIGFIRIEEGEKSSEYKFYRLQDIENRPKYEKYLFDKLFKSTDEGYITTSKIKTRMSSGGSSFKTKVVKKFQNGKTRLLTKKSVSFSNLVMFFAYICFCLIGFYMAVEDELMSGIIAAGFMIAPFSFLQLVLKNMLANRRKRRVGNNLVRGILYGALVLIIWLIIVAIGSETHLEFEYSTLMYFGSLFLVLMSYYTQQMTEYGHEQYERVLGFRHFLLTAEKDWLERLAKDNPEFFYDRLPYAMVLGVSKVWIGKFASAVTVPPSWYTGTSAFDSRTFSSHMMSDFSRIGAYAVPKSSSSGGSYRSGSSSSFSSGGGFSGGGFSGGGSSSW